MSKSKKERRQKTDTLKEGKSNDWISLQRARFVFQEKYSLHGAGHYSKSWLSLNLSKNILLPLWNPKVHHRVHTSPQLDPILSQLNPVRPIDPYLAKVQFNVIKVHDATVKCGPMYKIMKRLDIDTNTQIHLYTCLNAIITLNDMNK
jgi:hypothetical protein